VPIASLLLALAALADGGVEPPPATPCDGSVFARALAVPRRDWQVACLRLDDARRVIAAVPLVPLDRSAAAEPRLRMALASGDEVVWRDDIPFKRGAAPELEEVLAKSEEWLVGLESQPLGPTRGVRVSVVGHWGGTTMSVREIALLFRVPPGKGPPALVWSGLGNTRESRLDYCRIDGIASFALVDEHTLERTIDLKPTINHETPVAPRRARQLEKECVAKPEAPKRFKL
jgi:hypothetical protein